MFRNDKDLHFVASQSPLDAQPYNNSVCVSSCKPQQPKHGTQCSFVGCDRVFRRKKEMKEHLQSHLHPVPESLKKFVDTKPTKPVSSSVPPVNVVMRLIPANQTAAYSNTHRLPTLTAPRGPVTNNDSNLVVTQNLNTSTQTVGAGDTRPEVTVCEREELAAGVPEAIVTRRVGCHVLTHVVDSNQQHKTLLLNTPPPQSRLTHVVDSNQQHKTLLLNTPPPQGRLTHVVDSNQQHKTLLLNTPPPPAEDDGEVSCARTDSARNRELSENAKRRQKLSKLSDDLLKSDDQPQRKTLKRSTSDLYADDDSVLRISLRHTSRSRKPESSGAARTLPRTLQPNEDNARRLQLNMRASRAAKRPRARSLSPTNQRSPSQQLEVTSSADDQYFEQLQLQTGWLASSLYSQLLCTDVPRTATAPSVSDYFIDV